LGSEKGAGQSQEARCVVSACHVGVPRSTDVDDFDDVHSEHEERWVSIGRTENAQTLVVIHTSAWIESTTIKVRVISARKADRGEVRDYENTPR
jgi:uncharacterized DUF497 family protein